MTKHTSEIVVLDGGHSTLIDGAEFPLVILDQEAVSDLRNSLSGVLTVCAAEMLVSLLGYPPILPRDDD